jgi:hypothetical protein
MQPVFLETPAEASEEVDAGLIGICLMQGLGETSLEAHAEVSSIVARIAIPLWQCVFTELGEMARVVAISLSVSSMKNRRTRQSRCRGERLLRALMTSV